MSSPPSQPGLTRILALVVLLAGAAHLLLFVVARVPLGSGPGEAPATTIVTWRGENAGEEEALWAEQALLLDAEPLFVPSPWNAASRLDEIARLRDETEIFPSFEPRLRAREGLWAPPAEAESPDLNSLHRAPDPLRAFGRGGATAVNPPRAPAITLEIRALAGSRAQFPSDITFDPGAVSPPDALWNPLEFLLVIDPATGTGMPLRLNSSGSATWDRAVTEALAAHPAVTRLPEGYFRVLVGG